ncbi:hypothetical protein [Elizabethkingia anophelis]|uniref:hypothetical protein n=1 Tax=Elizabethkingia anophelis TaxID=1117645 RepID=UPI000C9A77EA|nr:hypothetical protein [Elizabethkingia anophelis]MCT3646534.1 hypothetical protein [Elizabethkingia anophelis]MCT3647620.1 hypothetical protein [Elizabethkingia anophelis]MCT3694143.1 hypothetical protein [Elizabethkingia anophelis]MCT3759781.1 hypothetical protein [Elizabethkingia anophelis]MCT3858329.1 hypothetical protein [Elizabethkingia anophelis]
MSTLNIIKRNNYILLFALVLVISCNNNSANTAVKLSDSLVSAKNESIYPKMQKIDSLALNEPQIEKVTDTASTSYLMPIPKVYYCIAVFHLELQENYLRAGYENKHKVMVSDVFEMMDISEDSKYRKLDELEAKASMEYRYSWNLTNREIKMYNSYSEASKGRQEFLYD